MFVLNHFLIQTFKFLLSQLLFSISLLNSILQLVIFLSFRGRKLVDFHFCKISQFSDLLLNCTNFILIVLPFHENHINFSTHLLILIFNMLIKISNVFWFLATSLLIKSQIIIRQLSLQIPHFFI